MESRYAVVASGKEAVLWRQEIDQFSFALENKDMTSL
jgi:hypothetical protein